MRASFEGKLGLNIDTFLQKDSLQQRVLVPQHETLIRSLSMALLQVLQLLFMVLDGSL